MLPSCLVSTGPAWGGIELWSGAVAGSSASQAQIMRAVDCRERDGDIMSTWTMNNVYLDIILKPCDWSSQNLQEVTVVLTQHHLQDFMVSSVKTAAEKINIIDELRNVRGIPMFCGQLSFYSTFTWRQDCRNATIHQDTTQISLLSIWLTLANILPWYATLLVSLLNILKHFNLKIIHELTGTPFQFTLYLMCLPFLGYFLIQQFGPMTLQQAQQIPPSPFRTSQ